MVELRESTVEAEIASLGDWFHNLHLPGDIQTAPGHPLGDFPARKWRELCRVVPPDLHGWRVLDIGCNAGYYSFALAARGAAVLGIDIDARYLAQARWAAPRMQLDDPPEFGELSVYRVNELEGPFDLVWFMGVAYHLRHPLLALDLIRSLEPRYLMFQTMTWPDLRNVTVPDDLHLSGRDRIAGRGWPKLAFVEHMLAGDPTNWWVANHSAAEALLRSSGFRVLDRPSDETWWCESVEPSPLVAAELAEILRARVR